MTNNITSKALVMQAMTGFKYGFVNMNYVSRNPTKNSFLPFSHHCLIKFHSNPPIFVIYIIVAMWVNSTNVYDPMTILSTLLSMKKKKCSFQIQYGKHLSISIHCFCYSYLPKLSKVWLIKLLISNIKLMDYQKFCATTIFTR